MSDLMKSTVKELSQKLQRKELSAVELTKEYIDNIKSKDEKINSYITVCEDEAMSAAKKSQTIIDSHKS
ncbi:MAG: Asp-tRNA(Asn)/Glu-tRNA(Gln) amidotransferase subunit GatA, partial [Oscillospiraceae bacterium]